MALFCWTGPCSDLYCIILNIIKRSSFVCFIFRKKAIIILITMFAFPITLSCFQSRSAVPNSLNRQPGLPSIIARPCLAPSIIARPSLTPSIKLPGHARPTLAQFNQRCHGLEVLNYLGGVNDVEILNISEQSAMPNFASFSHSWLPKVCV